MTPFRRFCRCLRLYHGKCAPKLSTCATPPEYENLIKTRASEPVSRKEGAVEGFLKDAADNLEVANVY